MNIPTMEDFNRLYSVIISMKEEVLELREILENNTEGNTVWASRYLGRQEKKRKKNAGKPYSAQYLTNMHCRGEMPALRRGRNLWFTAELLDAWLDAGRPNNIEAIERELSFSDKYK